MDAVTLKHVDKSYTSYSTEIVLTGQARESRTRQVLQDLTVEFPVGQLTVIHVGILPFRPNGNAFRPFGREWGGAVDFWAQGQYTTAMMIKQVLNDLRT